MGTLREAINRSRRRVARAPGDPRRLTGGVDGAAGHSAPAPAPPADDGRSELARRRDALADQVTEMHWDLGGLAYEMAIRDHFRLDVLVRLAAELQQVDAELGEVERLLRLDQAGAAGACPSCDALYGRGAVYCWQCGASLMPQAPLAAAPVAS
jgi:hypothetical protein